MVEEQRDQTPTRRVSDPHQHHHHRHQHQQPRYATPDTRPRRHTEGSPLTKVHSRPEDYRNKPRTGKMVEYICFDGEKPPQESDENKHEESTDAPLDRHDSHSTTATARTANSSDLDDDVDYDGDSEDELTLPPTYHHDIGSRDDDAWPTRHGKPHRHQHTHTHDDAGVHMATSHDYARDCDHSYAHTDHGRRSAARGSRSTSSSSSSQSRSRQQSPTSSDHAPSENNLIAQVAQHLQKHRDAYASSNASSNSLVNELLAEVVRKVADGGLDGDLMKEVVREVQHVL